MSGTGAFKVFVALHMVDYASRHLMHFSSLAGQAGQGIDKINNKLKIMGGLAGVMIGGAVVGAMVNLAKHSIEASTELDNVERRLKAIGGVNLDVFKKVSAQGWNLGNQFHASTQAERLQIFGDLHSVFGDPKTAQKMWPIAMQFQMAMKGVKPDTGEREFFAAFKAAELSTPTHNGHIASPEAFQHRLNMFAKIYAGTMGRVAPSDMYAFTKQAKYLRFNLTDEAYFKAAALMYEQGGSVTGSAYQALARVAGGKLGNSSAGATYAKEWERMGLLANITERSKQGNPKRFNVVGRDLIFSDPNKWAEDVFMPAMLRKGYTPENKGAFLEQLIRMFGNQTAGNAVFTMLQQKGILHKDAHVFATSKNPAAIAAEYQKSYKGGFDALSSSLEDLHAAIGKALKPYIVPALHTLANVFRALGDFTNKHPRAAVSIMVLLTAMGLLVAVISGAGLVAGLMGATTAAAALVPAIGGIAAICWPAIAALAALAVAIVGFVKLNDALGDAAYKFKAGGKPHWINQSASQFSAEQKFRGMIGLPSATGFNNGAYAIPSMTNSGNKISVTNHITVNESKEGLAAVKEAVKNAVNPTSGFTHTSSFMARNGYGLSYG